jgi:sugar lactone lactonase YvrE
MPATDRPVLTAVRPAWAVEHGRIDLEGTGFAVDEARLPVVLIGDAPARVVFASSRRLGVLVPPGLTGGPMPVTLEQMAGEPVFVDVGVRFATGLHQVDNPVFDREGNLYVTYSGSRGQKSSVSIFRVRPNGNREAFVSGITNPTSMALDPGGVLHVSSRFEGAVYRVGADGSTEVVATDLGIACGLAFDREGTLYAGDRSGTIFRVTPDGRVSSLASLPSSVAAFHLAMGPDDCLYVTGPTLASYDAVYRIDRDGASGVVTAGFGRPQGLAFDSDGALYVVEALAGSSGLYRLRGDGARELVLSAPGLVGVAFDPLRGVVVASNETAYRLEVGVRGGES